MASDHKIRPGTFGAPNARLIMVLVGLALFVIGFLVTVGFFSQTTVGGLHDEPGMPLSIDSERFDSGADFLVLVGIMTSLAGVVIATVGPILSLVLSRGRLLQ
jgi:hypothetical protein